jgi:hypothetical protein
LHILAEAQQATKIRGAAHEVRIGYQSESSEADWPHDSANVLARANKVTK